MNYQGTDITRLAGTATESRQEDRVRAS